MIDTAYVINLADSTERWRSLQPLLDVIGIPERIRCDAVNGAALGIDALHRLEADGRLRVPGAFDSSRLTGEIGCVLSHAGVLADIVRRQLPVALILEDDIALAGPARTWRRRFERAHADLPGGWALWYLYRCFDVRHRARRLSPRIVVPFRPLGGAAYVVTLQGARTLLAALTPASAAVDRVYELVVRDGDIAAYAASPLLILPGRHPSIINRDNPSQPWIRGGVNRPPEYWPIRFLDHLGETPPPGLRSMIELSWFWQTLSETKLLGRLFP